MKNYNIKMDRKTYFVSIILPIPVPGTFSYRVPLELNDTVKVGQRAVVQFGKSKIVSGLISEITDEIPDCEQVKYISDVLDEFPVVNKIQLKFWQWICDYYLCYMGDVMQAALPSAMKLSSESKIILSADFELDVHTLNDFEYLIVEALQVQPKLTISEVSKIIGYKKVMPLIKSMIDKNIIVMEEELDRKFKTKMERFVSLTAEYREEESLHLLMDELSKRAYKQLEVVMSFFALGGNADNDILASELLKKANANNAVLKCLHEKGVFKIYEKSVSRLKSFSALTEVSSIQLTEKQTVALDEIRLGFEKQMPVLLHGVTSSGKTEIYIKLIQKAINEGRQVLYLLPEIALTEQIINRLRKYFGDKVGVYHSRYGEMERVEIWNQVLEYETTKSSKYQIVIGSRSSILLPFSNLGLIIVDEEHDSSFKQIDPAPRYNARDLAIILAKMHNANVILGSATPSFESYFNARQGRYQLVTLAERFGGVEMPEIVVDDMRVEKRRKLIKENFGSLLVDAMEKTLNDKNQVILFQNRRGFSLRLECSVCNWIPQCINCDVSMTYHKAQNLMKCHYCGYTMSVPAECPSCRSTDLKMKGFGTERIEEDLKMILPEARCARLDLDTTRSKNSYQFILEQFKNRETDILVGTQMVTKGLDFDHVKTVGILDADNMLSFPDFRAFERSFQLMEQVSGRAGRKGGKGKVIIQTFQPTHPVILNVIRHDYVRFYEEQMPIRRRFCYPPYYRLVLIKLKHVDYEKLNKAADSFARQLRPIFRQNLLGPEYPIVSRVRNQYIKQVLIKIDRGNNTLKAKELIKEQIEIFKHIPEYKAISVSVDVDPN